MQSIRTRNSSDGRAIRRGLWVLVAVVLTGATVVGANGTAEGASAALGGLGVLLVSAGSVVLVRGR